MPLRILLVEDDPVSRDLLSALLASRGHEVDTAADGFNGLRLAQDQAYDLVFVDYHLPEMDGYAFARLMRSLAERVERALKMVAITADQFGLAARRGADTVFDRFLSKPIDPDALFAFVESFVAVDAALEETLSDIDAFLSEPTPRDAQTASQVLWRVRGLSRLPNAAVFPEPTTAERQGLEYCFTITEPDKADCLVVLNDAGLPALAALRQGGAGYLAPVLGIGDKALAARDAAFNIGDAGSWTEAAGLVTDFQRRMALLKPDARETRDVETRLLAYLFVSEKPIRLRRDSFGRTSVAFTGGFDPARVIGAIKSLAAKGLVVSRLGEATAEGDKELSILLSDRGQASILEPRAARDRLIAG
jgi:CheY-like chemotaxis protein